MNRLLPISLILLLFASQTGYYFFYSFIQHEISEQKERVLLQQIPRERLEIIEVNETNPDFSWEEEGREFTLKGQLYDVVKSVSINGRLLLYCVKDEPEQKLKEALSKASRTGYNNNTAADGKQTSLTIFTLMTGTSPICPGQPPQCLQIFYPLLVNLQSTVKEPFTPPPQRSQA